MVKVLFFVFLAALPIQRAAADALPAFTSVQNITIDLQHPPGSVDSVSAILMHEGTDELTQFDTFHVAADGGTETYGRTLRLTYSNGQVKIKWRKLKWFQIKLLIASKGKIFESPILTVPTTENAYFVLAVGPEGIMDNTPFFKTRWSEYFLLLFLTIAIEIAVASLFLRRWKLPYERNLLVITTAILVSYLLVWTVCTYLIGFGWAYVWAQIGVILFEAWWFWFFSNRIVTFNRSLRLSLRLNAWSFIIIGIMLFFVKG